MLICAGLTVAGGAGVTERVTGTTMGVVAGPLVGVMVMEPL
jgi:hypothetical protein